MFVKALCSKSTFLDLFHEFWRSSSVEVREEWLTLFLHSMLSHSLSFALTGRLHASRCCYLLGLYRHCEASRWGRCQHRGPRQSMYLISILRMYVLPALHLSARDAIYPLHFVQLQYHSQACHLSDVKAWRLIFFFELQCCGASWKHYLNPRLASTIWLRALESFLKSWLFILSIFYIYLHRCLGWQIRPHARLSPCTFRHRKISSSSWCWHGG